MPAEFAALPPNVSDSDALTIEHFKEVATRLTARGEDLRAQYYVDRAYALAAGQPVTNGVAIGSGDARVTTTSEQLSDGVTVTNLRAQALNTRPLEEILEQPPAFARVERRPIHQSQAADTYARHVAASESPVIAKEPKERIGPIKIPSLIGRALAAAGLHGRITTGYQSPKEYDQRHQEVLGTLARGVANSAEQQVRARASAFVGQPDFQEAVEATAAREADAAETNRVVLMLDVMAHPELTIPDWVSRGPVNLNREDG